MDKRVMLITGTRAGIGRQLAEHYANEGFQVFGCSRGDCDFSHENYEHFSLDITDETAVKKMFSSIRKACRRLDVLINNAGVFTMNHSLLTPITSAQNVLNINVIGTFLVSREAAKLMKKRDFGRIINFTSIAVPFQIEGEAVYAASKAAVVSLTKVMAREYAEFGITVNCLGPGLFKTGMIQDVPDEEQQHLLDRMIVSRYAEGSDVSNLIDFLIRPESGMVSGEAVYLGGV